MKQHTRREAPDSRCSTIDTNHQPIPLWLDPTANAIYDQVQEPDGTKRWRTWWQWYSESRGIEEAQAERESWKQGITDLHGNWWCGNCHRSATFINTGAEMGYPDLYTIYALKATQNSAGYERWLHIARTQSLTALTVLDILAGRIRVAQRELKAVCS